METSALVASSSLAFQAGQWRSPSLLAFEHFHLLCQSPGSFGGHQLLQKGGDLPFPLAARQLTNLHLCTYGFPYSLEDLESSSLACELK